MNAKANHLFVYGSLLSGFNQPAFEYIRRYFTFIAPAEVNGVLYDLGEYPAAIPVTDDKFIIGELYALNHEEEFSWAFSQLDSYEGIHSDDNEESLYKREVTRVQSGDGVVDAWVYWYNGDVTGKPLLTSGNVADYFRHKHNH